VKWIITNKSMRVGFTNVGGIPRNMATYNAIPSASIDDDLVQYMIVHKKAQPATPLVSIILDWMYCWGRGQDVNWFCQVVDWLHFLLYHGIHLSDKLVLRDCVEYRIRKMILERGQDVNTSIASWHQFFDEQYDVLGVTHFYDLAVFSFQWFHSSYYANPIPTSPATNGPAVVMSSP
jgi:hypothetical protein